MKKVLLLAPRLDISFKQNFAIKKIPKKKPTTMPIRLYWDNFITNTINEYSSRSDVVLVVEELPLWQFNQKVIDKHTPDIVLVPHKESHNFPVKNSKAYYYMQTTMPWIFSVDSLGWAGGASVYPYDSILPNNIDATYFNMFRDRALTNQSKFDQPEYKELALPDQYALFACQITYDETIKYHSKVGVEKALIAACKATEKLGISLVVKGHPINPDNMTSLRESVKKYPHVKWINNASIHQLIANSKCVLVVNSGVGMEALLHKKPVITFGQAEYDCVTNHASIKDLEIVLENLTYDEDKVLRFFDGWYNWCYDTTQVSSFKKLP